MGEKMTFDERLKMLVSSSRNRKDSMAFQEVLDYFSDIDLTGGPGAHVFKRNW